jgi:lipopolysaccharide/colanic/teichoic acid biosynthesis glycosyltransferase
MVRNADAIKGQLESHNEAVGPIFKMKNDPRVTNIGRILRRYSLDELPQLVNVLRGEMSLVGPRPHLPSEVACYTERQGQRLKVQPGLLCFREVFGRSKMSFHEWVELDLLYLEHRSFRTDWRILRRTLPAVLSAEGAC